MVQMNAEGVAIVRADAADTSGDVLVIPTTTEGSYGQHWQTVLDALDVDIPAVEAIPLGGIRVHRTGAIRFGIVALAATVGRHEAPTTAIESIGVRLGRLAADLDESATIVTPILGTGFGRLDYRSSVRALLRGFRSVPGNRANLLLVTNEQQVYDEIRPRLQDILADIATDESADHRARDRPRDGIPLRREMDDGVLYPDPDPDPDADLDADAGSRVQPARVLARPASDTVPDRHLVASDRLGLVRDVEMIASVALACETPLPLAIGLFGEWGSGKSFFLAMLAERVGELASGARRGDDKETFCGHVRQIHFNAWHYAEENLWASLASTIFDGLAVDPTVAAQIELTDALGDATREQLLRRKEREAAEVTLRAAEAKADSASAVALSAVPAALELLRDSGSVRADLESYINGTDDAPPDDVADLIRAYEAAVRTGQRGLLFRRLAVSEARRQGWRLAFTLVLLLVPLGAALWLNSVDAARSVAATVTALALAASPCLIASSRLLARARDARVRRDRPVEAARSELLRAAAAEARSDQEVAARELDLRRLRDRGQRLQDLIARARTDYGSHLGMLSSLRKDFQELADLLSPNGDTHTGSGLKAAAQEILEVTVEGEHRPVDESPLDVERIVLYIDDLDRCPADVVVKVLQAVNLMLTFKLFVVIVAVDGRWLEKSLTAHYSTLLSSPAEYLEKIIQLPFALQPMEPAASAALINDLTDLSVSGQLEQTDEADLQLDRPQADSRVAPVAPGPADFRSTPLSGEPPPPPPRPESLRFTSGERELLAQLGALLPTPRSVKRTINIYRMLKVCSGLDAERSFSMRGHEYEAVIVLLALLMLDSEGQLLAFERIRAADPGEHVWTVLESPIPHGAGPAVPLPWSPLLRSQLRSSVSVGSISVYQTWLPMVSRFSYRSLDAVPPRDSSL